MQIDIQQFLEERQLYPLSRPGWNTCKICHQTDVALAQSDTRLQGIQAEIGRKVGGVYVYHDAAGECIYVGKSADLANRFKTHFQRTHKRDSGDKRDKHFKFWSARPGDMTIRYFAIEREVDRKLVEIMLIELLEPAFEMIPRVRRRIAETRF